MYLNTGRPGPRLDLKDLKSARTVFNLKCLCFSISVEEVLFSCVVNLVLFEKFLWSACWRLHPVFVPLFYRKHFSSLTCFLSVSLSPFVVFRRVNLILFSQNPLCLLSPLLQVLKPLSEHYMEDNVRQTVVNSIKASLTEQGSQHTKLKTHWCSSSSSSPPSCLSPSCPLAQCAQS